MIELKPCPFCGSDAQYCEKPLPKVECIGCRAKIEGNKFWEHHKSYPDFLARLWNRRYPNENPETRQG